MQIICFSVIFEGTKFTLVIVVEVYKLYRLVFKLKMFFNILGLRKVVKKKINYITLIIFTKILFLYEVIKIL